MKKVIVAPLNWGLGHATRCIPVINSLLKEKFTVVLASDGEALKLLRKEFPELEALELPSYHISYTKKLWLGLLFKTPAILFAARKEKAVIAAYLKQNIVCGIISDNRFGARHKDVPSVYISHQLQVFSGLFTFATSRVHQGIMKKFTEAWVPDSHEGLSLSGKLSRAGNVKIRVRPIGLLSRLKKEILPQKYKIIILLSGPEPQRTQLEELLLKVFSNTEIPILWVRGLFSEGLPLETNSNIEVRYHMLAKELQKALNQSELVLARPGYSTLMDLAHLEKKAFFIPTPGQFEQEYLAERMQQLKIAPYEVQSKFNMSCLERLSDYTGFTAREQKELNPALFKLFKGE